MNRAYATVAGAVGVTGFAIFYAHYTQITERERMHRGVLRDIERDQADQLLALQLASTTSSTSSSSSSSTTTLDCESGICDLAKTRFRDPNTLQIVSMEMNAQPQQHEAR